MGLVIKRQTWHDYETESKKADYNQPLFIKTYKDSINAWLNKVTAYVLESFREKHFYYHLLEPERSAFTIPHPLGPLTLALEGHLRALEEIVLDLEEKKNLQVRREIAESETNLDVLYKVTYSDHTRLIRINNIVLAKPDFESTNDLCFTYLYGNPNKPIAFDELNKMADGKLEGKRLSDIVRDLGFTGVLKTIFFPVVTKAQIKFVNPITKEYAYKNDLPLIDFNKIGRQMEPDGDKNVDTEPQGD